MREGEKNEHPGLCETLPLAPVVCRNIQTLVDMQRGHEARKSRQDRIADAITKFIGSMPSVYAHAVFYSLWLIVNAGWIPGIHAFDPFPFVMLAVIASVEAIFLTSFVLVSQNRMAELDERRANLDLQISLLAEHEITRLIQMLESTCNHFNVPISKADDLSELARDVAPEALLEAIDHAENGLKHPKREPRKSD